MTYKFDEASWRNKAGDIVEPPVKLELLNELKKRNEAEYLRKYNGRLFCPECHIPQLGLVRFINSDDYFLRGYPKQEHNENCSFLFPPVENEVIDTNHLF